MLFRFIAIKTLEYGIALTVIALLIGLKILYPSDWVMLLIVGFVLKGLVDWWFLPLKVIIVREKKLERTFQSFLPHLPRYWIGVIVLALVLFLPYVLVKIWEILAFVPTLVGNLALMVLLGPLVGRIVGLVIENLITLPLDVLITLPKYWYVMELVEGKIIWEALKGAFLPFKEFGRWWKEITFVTFLYSLVPSLVRDLLLLMGWLFWPVALVVGIALEAWAEAYLIEVAWEVLKSSRGNN
ncbi:MAG: hypothetical protein GXN92_02950 [Candidatus Micrarchaeota archaeon]|nr:hypothetical protein [Candidatus Micrarchaeota archaeon]